MVNGGVWSASSVGMRWAVKECDTVKDPHVAAASSNAVLRARTRNCCPGNTPAGTVTMSACMVDSVCVRCLCACFGVEVGMLLRLGLNNLYFNSRGDFF